MMLLSVDCFRKNRPSDVEIPFLGAGGEFQARFIRLADLRGNIQTHAEADETFPRLKSQQRAVLQQLMASPDPTVQATLREPANLGFIKSLIGLSELVVPGEDARTKQLREIQQLMNAAPIAVPLQTFDRHSESAGAGEESLPALRPEPQRDSSGNNGPRNDGGGSADAGVHFISTVPVDELLDDHAAEFEECRRWASSDAGQLARAHNPPGFANVRAHAAEHAAALARLAAATVAPGFSPALPSLPPSTKLPVRRSHLSREFHTTSATAELQTTSSKTYPPNGSGEHWVTLDGKHVLIRESQGTRNQPSPQSPPTAGQTRLAPLDIVKLIPIETRREMARAIEDSKKKTGDPKNPTPQDDRKGGMHEESGIAGPDINTGIWKVARDKPGPSGDPSVDTHIPASEAPVDPKEWQSIDPKVVFHVHPDGQSLRLRPDGTVETHNWVQPPSKEDKEGAPKPEDLPPDRSIIVFAAREKKVYFYDKSGVTGTMSLKDFLTQ
jgi:hypothetical protein